MHRHRPLISPLDVSSPEEDLCEISMQLDQNDMGVYQQRIPPVGNTAKGNRFDGWIRAQQKSPTAAHSQGEQGGNRCITAIKVAQGQKKRVAQGMSQQFRRGGSRPELRRAYSHELQSQWNSVLLKQSREFYQNNESSPALSQLALKRRKVNEKAWLPRQLLQQVQIQAVNYPILSGMAQGDSPKKLVPHIGKIRHLINVKARRWP